MRTVPAVRLPRVHGPERRPEVVGLYGKTGRFDVIGITDHILMRRDLLARAGRLATHGYKNFSVTEERFDAYLARSRGKGSARRSCTACSSSPAPR